MWVCGLFSSLLFLIVLTATTTKTADSVGISSPCGDHSRCPDNGVCVQVFGRKQCACKEGYAAFISSVVCERAVYLNQPCITRCAGFFTVCNLASKLCVCSTGYVPAADGKNCVEKGKGLLGEGCKSECAFNLEQVCVEGVCRCNPGSRPMTKEEIRASYSTVRQCINSTFSSDPSTASYTPTHKINYAEPPSQVNHTGPSYQANHTEPPSQSNHTGPPDGNGAKMRAPHTSEMTTGFAVGISTAVFLTLIAFVVVVVVVRKRKSRVDNNHTNNKSANVTEEGLRNSLDVTEPAVDGNGVTSLTEGSKLPSRDVPSVVYSNSKIKENKAKQALMTKRQAEETPSDDSAYNTLSTANVKSRDNEPDHMDGYNTLYNVKT